jgi:hypothetical protein
MFPALSTSSWILFGVIALVAVVVIWKWWNKPVDNSKKNDDAVQPNVQLTNEEETGPPPETSLATAEPPPMVFAVNDDGNFDLTDMSGKILNIGFGPNPKTYINLLDQAEKDTDKQDTTQGVSFVSKVGNTKLYQVGGRPYIVNFTRLA